MKPGVSIVICCYNSFKRLPETLMSLSMQRFSKPIPWEVIIVDNASTDNTAEVARNCWPSSSEVALRIIHEPKAGVGNARIKSFSESDYEYISFVDDDNWVDSCWVETVFDFFQEHSEATAVGGQSVAVYESNPPEWFDQISSFYAIGAGSESSGEITWREGSLLWAAGLSLRREAGLHLLEQGFKILLCGGDEFTIPTGEDTELCFALRATGGRLFYEPKLSLRHFMPADRLTWPKALKMMHAMGQASPILELYITALKHPPFASRPVWKQIWLFNYLKMLKHFLRLIVAYPDAFVFRREGRLDALEIEKAKGALKTLWLLKGRYTALKHRIANAPWNLNREN